MCFKPARCKSDIPRQASTPGNCGSPVMLFKTALQPARCGTCYVALSVQGGNGKPPSVFASAISPVLDTLGTAHRDLEVVLEPRVLAMQGTHTQPVRGE